MSTERMKLADRINRSYLVTLNKGSVAECHLNGVEIELIIAALRAPEADKGEVVAWINHSELADIGKAHNALVCDRENVWHNTPLYASTAADAGIAGPAATVYRCGDAGCMCAPGTSCDPAPAAASADAVREFRQAACEAIQSIRHATAANFTDANCQGQRGEDRCNALYEASVAVRDLPFALSTPVAGADAGMREALKPFAELASHLTEKHRDSRPIIYALDTAKLVNLTIGDLRRAKAALSPDNGGSHD